LQPGQPAGFFLSLFFMKPGPVSVSGRPAGQVCVSKLWFYINIKVLIYHIVLKKSKYFTNIFILQVSFGLNLIIFVSYLLFIELKNIHLFRLNLHIVLENRLHSHGFLVITLYSHTTNLHHCLNKLNSTTNSYLTRL